MIYDQGKHFFHGLGLLHPTTTPTYDLRGEPFLVQEGAQQYNGLASALLKGLHTIHA